MMKCELKTMKKVISFILVLVITLAFILGGCNEKSISEEQMNMLISFFLELFLLTIGA